MSSESNKGNNIERTIELYINESGDWTALYVDGKPFEEGHSIPDKRWLDLLERLGNKVEYGEISDEEMEGM